MIDFLGNFKKDWSMTSSLLHLVGLQPRVYYTLTNFRRGGGGGQGGNTPMLRHSTRGGLDLPPHCPTGGGPLAQPCIFYELICCETYLNFHQNVL